MVVMVVMVVVMMMVIPFESCFTIWIGCHLIARDIYETRQLHNLTILYS